MKTDFQSTLQALGKQAKKEAEEKAAEEAAAKKQEAENADFASMVGTVTPAPKIGRASCRERV